MYSLNEIQSMAKMAFRGADASWGLAEEAALAVRWLEAAGLPGAEALAQCISQPRQGYMGQASEGPFCPISLGAAISDTGDIRIVSCVVAAPLLLAPFIARTTDRAVMLTWQGGGVSIAGAHACLTGNNCAHAPARVRLEAASSGPLKSAVRQEIPPETWHILHLSAQRTRAPATEASRRAGAGAGLTDND